MMRYMITIWSKDRGIDFRTTDRLLRAIAIQQIAEYEWGCSAVLTDFGAPKHDIRLNG